MDPVTILTAVIAAVSSIPSAITAVEGVITDLQNRGALTSAQWTSLIALTTQYEGSAAWTRPDVPATA